MPIDHKPSRFDNFQIGWRRLLIQGIVILSIGVILSLASIFNANAMILFAGELSWLPLSGMVILALGLLACFDAFLAKEPREFHHNIQVGMLDVIVGSLIILSVAENPMRFSMMLAAFLMTRGGVRIAMAYALTLPHKISTIFAGAISIMMGLMIWLQWPVAMGWFFALCLNIELMFRGWATIIFAIWLRKQHQGNVGKVIEN